MANSVDPDQMPHSVASDLGLHSLLRPVCPNSKGYYGLYTQTTKIHTKSDVELFSKNVSKIRRAFR